MALNTTYKSILDLPEWRMLNPAPAAPTSGYSICSDFRNDESRDPFIYYFPATNLYRYSSKYDAWQIIGAHSIATSVIAGATSCYMTRGPRGTLAAGATTTTITLSTALPGTVGVNELANRGDCIGYKIRIIGNAAGSSGKTEERFIISNTGGTTTPTITLDSPLTFTPILNDTYEFLSGRVYLLGSSALTANSCKYYDVATQVFTSTATPVGTLPATIGTDSCFLALDEQYVPATNVPGEGFLTGSGPGGVAGRALTATDIPGGSLSLTGQAIGGDAGVLQHEYRNFQIRIVCDPARPTAVGQRRKITGHTAGPSPTYTITPAWTVDPSTDTQYVIENANELLLWTTANTTTYTYVPDAIGGAAANTWNSGIYGVRPAAMGVGCIACQNFAPTLDVGKTHRYSYIFSFRSAATADLHLLDIAGGVTGLWSTIDYAIPNTFAAYNATYDPISGYFYIGTGTQYFFRFCPKTKHMEPWQFLRSIQSTATTGNKMATIVYIDGTEKASFIYYLSSSLTTFFNILPLT